MSTVGEDVAAGIRWYLEGRGSAPPPEVAAMTEQEQARVWEAARDLVAKRGEDYALAVVGAIGRNHVERSGEAGE